MLDMFHGTLQMREKFCRNSFRPIFFQLPQFSLKFQSFWKSSFFDISLVFQETSVFVSSTQKRKFSFFFSPFQLVTIFFQISFFLDIFLFPQISDSSRKLRIFSLTQKQKFSFLFLTFSIDMIFSQIFIQTIFFSIAAIFIIISFFLDIFHIRQIFDSSKKLHIFQLNKRKFSFFPRFFT